jgi:hypothetical protein
MSLWSRRIRVGLATAVVAMAAAGSTLRSDQPATRTVPPVDPTITWVLPSWVGLLSANDAAMADMVRRLRQDIGDGPRARIGLSVFVQLSMNDWSIDTRDRTAVRAALRPVIAPIDAAIARARVHRLPIGLSIITAIRERVDPVQTSAERDDRRNVQWYQDHSPASGWVTYSQYARKLRRVQEAYVREFGRMLAERMAQDPDILVAVTGDGETEMSYERFRDITVPIDASQRAWADYSPFAIAEFRDWLRAGGLYAAGQPLAGEAYALSARYAGDASPAVDTNGDGHTLNRDAGTSFTSWNLRYFNWSLTDAETAGAVSPAGFVVRDGGAALFDAPRPAPADVLTTATPLWQLWVRFRQEMIQRYNRDFARWITGASEAASGGVPRDRWYSAQIPTDLLFGDPPADKGVRWFTSGSAHWTADIAPYGGMGVTGYNVNMGNPPDAPPGGAGANGPYAKTTPHVMARAALRSARWGIVEWNPSDPWSTSADVYLEDVDLIRRYRPSLLMPFKINTTHYRVFDSGFVPALRTLMQTMPAATASAAPIGVLESPAKEARVPRSAIPITGWALDDTGLASVDVVRDCLPSEEGRSSPCFTVLGRRVVFLGVATRVAGARPDVAAAMPTYAEGDRAGWGYTLDGGRLPATPVVTIHVIATDLSGQRTIIGTTTLTLTGS